MLGIIMRVDVLCILVYFFHFFKLAEALHDALVVSGFAFFLKVVISLVLFNCIVGPSRKICGLNCFIFFVNGIILFNVYAFDSWVLEFQLQ
jgi:hypothetical protein